MLWINKALSPHSAVPRCAISLSSLILSFHLSSPEWFSSTSRAFLARLIKEVSTHLFPSPGLVQ